MASILAPFLYQTRTIQRLHLNIACRRFRRLAHTSQNERVFKKNHTIPFDWEQDDSQELLDELPENKSTITPSEAEVFKSIFDEIAQGRMPTAKKRDLTTNFATPRPNGELWVGSQQPPPSEFFSPQGNTTRSLVEQARVTEFRDKFLKRYPTSLRNAAQIALGLYELEPAEASSAKVLELDEANEAKWAERARYDQARRQEQERVDALMSACTTDVALWKVMEKEVFSLPERVGIIETTKPKSTMKRADISKSSKKQAVDDAHVMDVHGPLYSHFINQGLALLETAFSRPSPLVFKILPRVKELGLPSYVLGVSTPFYTRLARIHWERFGDAASALDTLQEMSSAGLYADKEVETLLVTIRDNVHGCSWGAQGPFVMAMMDSPPYDGALAQRLDDMRDYVRESIVEREREYGP